MKKLLIVFALTLVAGSAAAQRTGSCTCGTPSQLPTPWVIRHADPNAQAAATEAFSRWNTYLDVFRPSASAGTSELGNGINEIVFYDYSNVPGLDPDTIVGFAPNLPDGAFGTPSFNQCPMPSTTSCGTITEADVWLNDRMPWNNTRPNTDSPGFVGYYASTAVHEIGHTMGMHHNFANISTMNYYHDFAGLYVSQTDVLALRAHFPTRAQSVTDLATYPFTYNANLQTGADDGDGAVTAANINVSNVAPGGKIVIKNWTVENLSSGSNNQTVILFYLSTNTQITTSDTYLGGFKWDPLGTNQYGEDVTGHEFTIPASTPAGSYYVGAIVAQGTSTSAPQDSITYNNSWVIPTPLSVGSNNGGGVCTPSSTVVCLNANRFQVTVTYDGQTMKANQFTADTGLFYVSDPSNIEVLVKVLNPCSFSPYFWLFSGGMTDRSIAITAVDTKTGRVKNYGSSGPFKTITATDAFPCN